MMSSIGSKVKSLCPTVCLVWMPIMATVSTLKASHSVSVLLLFCCSFLSCPLQPIVSRSPSPHLFLRPHFTCLLALFRMSFHCFLLHFTQFLQRKFSIGQRS